MLRRVFESQWPYLAVAGALLCAAVLTQFEIRTPSRKVAPVEALAELRERGDLNVVFLLIDTLRADRLGIYGYERPTSPNIDALARRGIVFENAVAQSSWTKTSMASLWTATHPINNGILRYNHVLPEEAVLPAEIFRDAGYRTVGLWRNGWVEPNFGFAQGFEIYVRPAPGAARVRVHRKSLMPNPLTGNDEDLTIDALDFLDRFGQDRFFLYVHYMDLHQYVYDEAAAMFGTSYSDAYDQAIHWTDRQVAALVGKLDEIGVLDRTLIAIASDHGEAFREHGFEGHARNLYNEVAHVPLILLPPFLLDPGVRVRETISNLDLWPTVLDLVGLPPLPDVDGRSLRPLILRAGGAASPPPTDGLERPVFAQLSKGWGHPKRDQQPVVSVTWEDKRLITRLDQPEEVELYDRASDPAEATDLYPEHSDVAGPLRELVADYEAGASSPWGAEPREIELDEMRLNQLQALGYVIAK